jgi:hypothetical protein
MTDMMAVQAAAIEAQKAAHKALKNGAEPVPADVDGPLSMYTRAQTLDYLAQLTVCLRDGAFLPNASGPGLTILPGTERVPLDAVAAGDGDDSYLAKIALLTEAGAFAKAEIAEAVERLEANLEAGVTLDPATAEHVA